MDIFLLGKGRPHPPEPSLMPRWLGMDNVFHGTAQYTLQKGLDTFLPFGGIYAFDFSSLVPRAVLQLERVRAHGGPSNPLNSP